MTCCTLFFSSSCVSQLPHKHVYSDKLSVHAYLNRKRRISCCWTLLGYVLHIKFFFVWISCSNCRCGLGPFQRCYAVSQLPDVVSARHVTSFFARRGCLVTLKSSPDSRCLVQSSCPIHTSADLLTQLPKNWCTWFEPDLF